MFQEIRPENEILQTLRDGNEIWHNPGNHAIQSQYFHHAERLVQPKKTQTLPEIQHGRRYQYDESQKTDF